MKCCLLLLLLPLSASAADLDKVLDSIAAVENTPASAVGKAGERSRYQMTYAVWHAYTSEPFARASSDESFARTVAMAHLCYLESALKRRGIPIGSRYLAQAWNGGINSFRRGVSAYARRVENVYTAKP